MSEATAALSEGHLLADPIRQFQLWYDAAVAAGQHDADAMTLATAATDARPSARMVLLKGTDDRGFTFFTNYDSRKGRHLGENPFAALVFFWNLPARRQVRIEGEVSRISDEESDAYFRTRPLESRISACASRQSELAPDRAAMEARAAHLRAQYAGMEIPRPPQWGGYRLVPDMIELWQNRDNRLHDRVRYRLTPSGWVMERLWP